MQVGVCCVDPPPLLLSRADSHTWRADAYGLYLQALRLVLPGEAVGGPSSATDAAAVLSSNVAAALLQLQRPDEALQHATAATQLRPTWPKAHYRQGVALLALQQYDEAAAALDKAARLLPPGTPEVSGSAQCVVLFSMLAEWVSANTRCCCSLRPRRLTASLQLHAQPRHASSTTWRSSRGFRRPTQRGYRTGLAR
jgi:tetratricopeptide (TPR) repeat protein